MLKAIALERLGHYYRDHNELEKAIDNYSQIGAIDKWALIGPFENISESGYNKNFQVENEFIENNMYVGQNGLKVKWFPISLKRHDQWIDLKRYFAANNAIFYGNSFFHLDWLKIQPCRI